MCSQIARRQVRAIIEFDDALRSCWEAHFGDEKSGGLPRYKKLVLRLLILHYQDKPLYKTAAAGLLPLTEKVSGMKYLHEAERRGWVAFIPSEIDRRKVQVLPTKELLQKTENYLTEVIESLSDCARELSQIEDPP